MPREYSFAFESSLRASPAAVWARVSTMDGVNDELFPLARMTVPRAFRGRDLASAPTGVRLFRSWILLLGALPVDYDDITLASLTPGAGFHEESELLSQRRWRHVRSLRPGADGGCVVRDEVAFTPRVVALGPVFLAVFRLAFANRHRRLRARFGGAP